MLDQMNKVFQINIIQTDNGFNVQSPTVGQKVVQDEAGVQEAVKELVTKLLSEPEPNRYGTQTIKKFGQEEK